MPSDQNVKDLNPGYLPGLVRLSNFEVGRLCVYQLQRFPPYVFLIVYIVQTIYRIVYGWPKNSNKYSLNYLYDQWSDPGHCHWVLCWGFSQHRQICSDKTVIDSEMMKNLVVLKTCPSYFGTWIVCSICSLDHEHFLGRKMTEIRNSKIVVALRFMPKIFCKIMFPIMCHTGFHPLMKSPLH